MWEARYLCYINNTTLVSIGHRANSNTSVMVKSRDASGCEESSIRCIYTRYSSRRERQRKPDAVQRAAAVTSPSTHNPATRDRRRSVSRESQLRKSYENIIRTSNIQPADFHTRHNKSLAERDLSVPLTTRALSSDREDVFSDQMLHNMLSDFGAQDVETYLYEHESQYPFIADGSDTCVPESVSSNMSETMSETIVLKESSNIALCQIYIPMGPDRLQDLQTHQQIPYRHLI